VHQSDVPPDGNPLKGDIPQGYSRGIRYALAGHTGRPDQLTLGTYASSLIIETKKMKSLLENKWLRHDKEKRRHLVYGYIDTLDNNEQRR